MYTIQGSTAPFNYGSALKTIAVGQYIYFFASGGTSAYKYNTVTDTYTTLAAKLNISVNRLYYYNNYIYLLRTSTESYKYDVSTDTYTEINFTLDGIAEGTTFSFSSSYTGMILGNIVYYFTTNESGTTLLYKYDLLNLKITYHGGFTNSCDTSGFASSDSTNIVKINNNILIIGQPWRIYNLKSEKHASIGEFKVTNPSYYVSLQMIGKDIYFLRGSNVLYKCQNLISCFPSLKLKQGTQFHTDADVYNSSYTLISGNTIPADGVYYFVGPDPYISIY